MKKLIILLLSISMLACLASCGEKKILTCDGCGNPVEVDASSKMDDDWAIYCSSCEKEFGLDTVVE